MSDSKFVTRKGKEKGAVSSCDGRRRLSSVVPVICVALFGACSDGPAPVTSAPIPASATAAPGTEILPAFDAGAIFADTCLIRGAAFESATLGLAGRSFVQNTNTGTYYHEFANLSVRVTPESCGMVYGSPHPENAVLPEFSRGIASVTPEPPTGVAFSLVPVQDDLRYYRISIQSSAARERP